jgi:hypothetical protein
MNEAKITGQIEERIRRLEGELEQLNEARKAKKDEILRHRKALKALSSSGSSSESE